MPTPFFADIGWFYEAARQAFYTGHFPIHGITTSVIWLHQGPLWTYFLIPALAIFGWHPIGGIFASILFHLLTLPAVFWVARIFTNRRSAWICLFLYLISPYVVVFSLTPFDTAPIPFLTLMSILLLFRRKYFYSFMFLGFLYQVERVSLIWWPVILYLIIKFKSNIKIHHLLGFILGSLPFVIAGPIEFFGPVIYAIYRIYGFLF